MTDVKQAAERWSFQRTVFRMTDYCWAWVVVCLESKEIIQSDTCFTWVQAEYESKKALCDIGSEHNG